MASLRSSQLTVGFCPLWKRQSAWDTPLANSDITKAFPAISKNYLELDEDTEDIMDCTGEDLLIEQIIGQRARLTLEFDVDPDLLSGFVGFGFGANGAATGGTSEIESETITATSGTRSLTVQVGANAQTTSDIPYNADLTAIQAALDALSNLTAGDYVVSGTGPFVYTAAGNLAKQDINQIVSNGFKLAGGTSVITTTTPGVGLAHKINRIVGYTLPLMTLYIGFRGSSLQPKIFKNVVVDSIRVRANNRGKVTATVVLIGSGDLQYTTGYTMPPCNDIVPIRFGDCALTIGTTDYIAGLLAREFEFFYQNDVIPIFDGPGYYATRHERADKRPTGFNFFILGEPGDDLFLLCSTKPRTKQIVTLRVGPTGRSVTFTAPQGLLKLAQNQIRFNGDPSESEIAVVVRPTKTSGNNDTPVWANAVTGLATAYCVSA